MCLQASRIENLNRWNWDGERIVQDTIVPSSRQPIGSKREYDMDVREFLATAHNAVLRRTIQCDIHSFVRSLHGQAAAPRTMPGRSFSPANRVHLIIAPAWWPASYLPESTTGRWRPGKPMAVPRRNADAEIRAVRRSGFPAGIAFIGGGG